jgi:site-specific DNA recombinase
MPSTNRHGPKRTILYARVSTDEQARSGYSLAQQIEALREYATREGFEVLEEIIDPGQSGASLERPGMDRVRDLGRWRRLGGARPRKGSLRPRACI